MASVPPPVSPELDDPSCPDTPVAPSVFPIPIIEAPDLLPAVDQLGGPYLAPTLKLPDPSGQFLSPTLSDKHIFSLADVEGLEVLRGSETGPLDITVAADGSFIETSSGPIARELKRRYDQLLGVGPTIRSPYAITGFVNQHGRDMYRIGPRDEDAPAASGVGVEDRIIQSRKSNDPSHSPKAKRRSRLSMFPPFGKDKTATPPSRPPTNTSTTSSSGKKLRKTRSIPEFGTEVIVTNAPTFAVTGRGHSQSVTAADLPRPSIAFTAPPPEQRIDFFGELMEWFTPSSSASSNFSSHSLFNPGKVSSEPTRPRTVIAQPFGNGVTFDVPSQKHALDRPPLPRHLREMQSFESGLTARQVDSYDDSSDADTPILDESDPADSITRPVSAIRLSILSSSSSSETVDPFLATDVTDDTATVTEPIPHLEFPPSAESLRLSSHYSSEVFNVLQTYRGLPTFENLVPESDEGTTVIKLSLAEEQSATPRDDPRFVIWGEAIPEQDPEDYHSSSRDSVTDNPPANHSSSSISKRRSSKVSRLRSPEASSSKLAPAPPAGQRVLLAATIERWIAQLTSDLNYDELLNFFLTYRTYVSAVDLCHLFICRFHWALQLPSSSQDETVRRIVRVRTFVAIRYWFVTFFTVDFIPNRDLRILMADWLNTLLGDNILKKHADAFDLVRRLIKVAKECKRAHTRATEKPKVATPPREQPQQPVDHLLGKSFAAAIRKPVVEDTLSDLDLDFLPDEAKTEEPIDGFPSDPANAHLTAGNALGGIFTGNRPTSLPLASLNILQRTEHAPGPMSDEESHYVQNGSVQLGMKHSALSRAFVRTIGRLGRWKSVLNSRSRPATAVACGVGVAAFDLEVSPSRDMLSMNGGVNQYLNKTEHVKKAPPVSTINTGSPPAIRSPIPPIPPLPTTPPPVPYSNGAPTPPLSPLQVLHWDPDAVGTTDPINEVPVSGSPVPDQSEQALAESSVNVQPESTITSDDECSTDVSVTTTLDDSEAQMYKQSYISDAVDRLQDPGRAQSFRSSSSTDSFGEPLTSDGPLPPTFPGQHNQWSFDVVSISEFSDTSSIAPEDPSYPPGLRKPPRKLPTRRDFEFVRRSQVSSMGIVSHESMRDSVTSSTHSGASPTSSGPRGFQKWQLKSLQQTFESMSNDEEDTGDVEAALRRLEGHINPKIQQEKAEKVNGWVRNLQERLANGDYEYEGSMYSEEEHEAFVDEVPNSPTDDDETGDQADSVTSSNDEQPSEESTADVLTPIATQGEHLHNVTPLLALDNSPRPKDSKAAIEDFVPLEILQSTSSLDIPAPPIINNSIDAILTSKFVNSDSTLHRSFILSFSADLLAQQFSIIDRELFMLVKFEELVSDDWVDCEEINVLDWGQYLKDRSCWKTERRNAEKTTALAALRARFNLMVSFVISEIVLTAPLDRPFLVSKFIRIAWRCYSLSNFHTLTAIITALQNNWVTKAMRKSAWGKIGTQENRMFKDLKDFTKNAGDFKFMRTIVDSIVDSKPLESSVHAASVVSGGDSQSGKGKNGSENRPVVPTACIPFIGIYLSQLRRHNKLPALIDPTTPNNVIGIDSVSAVFDPPAHPEVFSNLTPLPPSMHLEPLINVHKQRRIADVIKSLVAGQHLASRIQFEVDKKAFNRCLRLRGMDPPTLQRALALYQD